MTIKNFEVGHLGTNCYIVTDENLKDCVVIDPGDETNTIMNYVEENGLNVAAVLITHGHYDHTGAAVLVAEEAGAPIYINMADTNHNDASDPYSFKVNQNVKYYADGDQISVGDLVFEIIDTPGHSRGSVTIKCENALFVGDLLFRDSCGRTDLPGGDLQVLLCSLKKIADLGGDYDVYPGHLEATTLDRERRFNQYVRYAINDRL